MLSFLEKFEKEFESSQKRIAQGLLILTLLVQLVLSFGVFGFCGLAFGILTCIFGNLGSFENESSQKNIPQGLLLFFNINSKHILTIPLIQT